MKARKPTRLSLTRCIYLLESIRSSMERTTSGNYVHHRAHYVTVISTVAEELKLRRRGR